MCAGEFSSEKGACDKRGVTLENLQVAGHEYRYQLTYISRVEIRFPLPSPEKASSCFCGCEEQSSVRR